MSGPKTAQYDIVDILILAANAHREWQQEREECPGTTEGRTAAPRHPAPRSRAPTPRAGERAPRNGTFVNETQLAPNQRVRLAHGARLRFAANLTALVSIRNDRP